MQSDHIGAAGSHTVVYSTDVQPPPEIHVVVFIKSYLIMYRMSEHVVVGCLTWGLV